MGRVHHTHSPTPSHLPEPLFHPFPRAAGFGIELDVLKKLILEKEVSHSDAVGGLHGIAKSLKTDLDHGLHTKEVRSLRRRLGFPKSRAGLDGAREWRGLGCAEYQLLLHGNGLASAAAPSKGPKSRRYFA